MSNAIKLLIGINLFLIFGLYQLGYSENTPYGNTVGKKAILFTLKNTEGKTVNLKDYIGKKTILLNFWATWCPACVREIPDLIKMRKTYSKKDLAIISVNIEDQKQEKMVKKFIKEHGITYSILLDPKQKVTRQYQIFGIPTNIIIDKSGVIQFRNYTLPKQFSELKKQTE